MDRARRIFGTMNLMQSDQQGNIMAQREALQYVD